MANQGQLWSSFFQIGKEVTPGIPVAATRKQYYDPASNLTVTQDPRVHHFAVARRDNTLSVTQGPTKAAGQVSGPISAAESLELFLMSLQGGVTPVVPSGATLAQLWTFKPSTNTDSTTMEWDDGARAWQGKGIKGNQITIAGSAMEANTVSVDLFGTDVLAGSMTGSLTDRVPDFLEGWQTRIYVDPFGGTPGATLMPGLLRNWSVQVQNQLDYVYTADNTLGANRVASGELNITATLTFDAFAAQALTEFGNWRATTKRLVRLEFVGPPAGIEAGINEIHMTTLTAPVGNLTPSFMGVAGAPVPSPYTAAALQASLRGIPTIGDGAVTVAGSNGGPFTITWIDRWGEYDVPGVITYNLATSGTAVDVQTTAGRSGRNFVTVDIPGAWTSTNLSGSANMIRTYEMQMNAVYDPVQAAMMVVRAQCNRATAY